MGLLDGILGSMMGGNAAAASKRKAKAKAH